MEDGLEVRLLKAQEHAGGFERAMRWCADESVLSQREREMLQINGLRLLRIDQSSLESMLMEWGEAIADVSVWHGQATEWRDLCTSVVKEGSPVVVDGRVSRLQGDKLELLIRAWTLLMEGGPCIHLESKTRLVRTSPVEYQALLSGPSRDLRAQDIGSLSFQLDLQPDSAYLLIEAPSATTWTVGGYDLPLASVGVRHATPVGGSSSRGPLGSSGPESSTPPTLGELLLPRAGPGSPREIIVLLPRVSQSMLPPLRKTPGERNDDSTALGHP